MASTWRFTGPSADPVAAGVRDDDLPEAGEERAQEDEARAHLRGRLERHEQPVHVAGRDLVDVRLGDDPPRLPRSWSVSTMTRTSSISGTFVNRQRSPVRVAAASSLRAAFFEPLTRTVAAERHASLDAEDLARHRRRRELPVERPGVSHRPVRRVSPRAAPGGALGDPDAQECLPQVRPGAGEIGRLDEPGLQRPFRASRRASSARSRSISEARSAVSAMTTTRSGSTWTNPPAMAKYSSSSPPFRMRSSPNPRDERSGAWCGRMPISPSLVGHATNSTSSR